MIDKDKVPIGLGQHISGRTPERCGICPYFNGDAGYGVTCRDELLDDLYELLESQEPHVLTLEEADNAPFVWLESKKGGLGVRRIRIVPTDSTAVAIQTFGRADTFCDIGTFEKEFRCWLARPTDEQREAEPWEKL